MCCQGASPRKGFLFKIKVTRGKYAILRVYNDSNQQFCVCQIYATMNRCNIVGPYCKYMYIRGKLFLNVCK
jgi:hypothetical protein